MLRDFAEAERRFASGGAGEPRAQRENLGRTAAEDAPKPRHP